MTNRLPRSSPVDHFAAAMREAEVAINAAIRAVDAQARVFATWKLDAAQSLSEADAQRVDDWMRANPEMGWLDALVALGIEA